NKDKPLKYPTEKPSSSHHKTKRPSEKQTKLHWPHEVPSQNETGRFSLIVKIEVFESDLELLSESA
ncbi:MAG: hypothetical protein Q7Q71_13260, partial [Verrucomicrobiota bacterium JB023]|nr:hypothetical protein [Verrucomicrobiota bacterium JB023]